MQANFKLTHLLEIAEKPMSIISGQLVNLSSNNHDTTIPGCDAVNAVREKEKCKRKNVEEHRLHSSRATSYEMDMLNC